MAQNVDQKPDHPVVVFERQLRDRVIAKHADYYAEELVFVAMEQRASYLTTQALLSLCRRKAAEAKDSGNKAEERSFKAVEPTLAQLNADADRMLYGDGNGNFD